MNPVNTEDTELFLNYDEGEEVHRIDPDYSDSYRIERKDYGVAEFMGREIVYQERKIDGVSKVIVPGYLIEEEHYPQDSESFDINNEEKAVEVAPVAAEDSDEVEKWLENIGLEGRFEFW
ncbi:MAG: hypothetical protein ACI9LV_000439 [Candidatus Nanohaloarchaea archaeon]|jgi:hypothetical protein